MLTTEAGILELTVDPLLGNGKHILFAFDLGEKSLDLLNSFARLNLFFSNFSNHDVNFGIFDLERNWATWLLAEKDGLREYIVDLSKPTAFGEKFPDLTRVRYIFFEVWPHLGPSKSKMMLLDIMVTLGQPKIVFPLSIHLWDTSTYKQVILRFTSDGNIEFVDSVEKHNINKYTIGEKYHIRIFSSRNKPISIGISSSDWEKIAEAKQPFNGLYTALTVSSEAFDAASIVELYNLTVSFPNSQKPVTDLWAYSGSIFLFSIYVAIIISLIILLLYKLLSRKSSEKVKDFTSLPALNRQRIITILLVIAVVLTSAFLFPLGNHPFDWYSQTIASYVASVYGLDAIYSVTNIISSAYPHNGNPFVHIGFAYGPVYADYFWFIGLLYRLITSSVDFFTFYFEALFKSFQIGFAIVSGLIIYCILKRKNVGFLEAVTAMLLFTLNPAVLFDLAIWGQTEGLLIMLLLLSALFLELDKPTLAWIFIAFAFLTKTTAVPLAFFMAIFAFKKFGLRGSITPLSRGIIAAFVASSPLLLAGYSPSILYSVVLGKALGAEMYLKETGIVTLDTFNIWPLVTYFLGASGDQRFLYHSTPIMVRIGQMFYLLITINLMIRVVFDKDRTDHGWNYLVLATVAVSMPLFVIAAISRYFLLALPFIILSSKVINRRIYYYLITVFSFTTFISLYGVMAMHTIRWPGAIAPENFIPSKHPLNQLIVLLFTNDMFITISSLLNIIGFILLLISLTKR
jgi:Gpi18-like mannosyltransferase